MQANSKKTNNSVNFQVIGLISHLQDYNLAWELNNALDFNFSKKEITEINFSCFYNEDPKIIIFENLKTSPYYIAEAKEFNFIIKLFTDNKNETDNFTKDLKKIKDIDFSSLIPLSLLKKKNFKFLSSLEIS